MSKKIVDRHKVLFKKISDNIRNGMTMEAAMKSVGYSDSYAKSSTALKDTESWRILMDKYLPDESLTKIHKKLLNKKEVLIRNNNITKKVEVIKTGQLHSDAAKALDMGYKLKGKYAAEKKELTFKNFNKVLEEIENE